MGPCITEWTSVTQLPCVVLLSGPALCSAVAQLPCVTQWPSVVLLSCLLALPCATQLSCVVLLDVPVLHDSVAQRYITQWPNVTQSPCVILFSVPVLHYPVSQCCITRWPHVVLLSGPVLLLAALCCITQWPSVIQRPRVSLLSVSRYSRSAGTRPAVPAGPAGWHCTRR